MPTATAGNGAFTPSTTSANWVLDTAGTTGNFGKCIAFGWGGREVSSVAYRTRWSRPITSNTTISATLTYAFSQPNFTTMGTRVATFSTSGGLAADPGGNLYAQDWNGQGGLGMVVLPLGNPWWVTQVATIGCQIVCQNVAGTTASVSSYEVVVEE